MGESEKDEMKRGAATMLCTLNFVLYCMSIEKKVNTCPSEKKKNEEMLFMTPNAHHKTKPDRLSPQ
jgi:hypothetical protein